MMQDEGWQPVARPGNDLPAAMRGAQRPDLILAAAHDLDRLLAGLNQCTQQVCLALLRGEDGGDAVAAFAGGRLWSAGAHRSVHRGSPLLASLDALVHDITAADAGAVAVRGPDRAPRLLAALGQVGDGLRQLLVDTWNRLANIDPLTGLGNRPAMLRRLAIECERHERGQQPCCVAVIDLDNFKAINDTHGHPAGDAVLRSIASLLAAGVRPYDEVFRYGGDEFVLCLPNTDLRTAWAVVERLRLRIVAWTIPLKSGERIGTTVSIGVAPLTAERGVQATLESADQSLYAVKRAGRNGICVGTLDAPSPSAPAATGGAASEDGDGSPPPSS